MRDAIEEYEEHGFTIRIHYDQDAESPRDWDNVGTIWTFDRRYNSPDKAPSSDPREAIESLASDLFPGRDLEELDDARLMALVKTKAIVMPVFKFEHGGIAYSCSDFGDPWDSGQVGWTFVTLERAREEFGVGKSKRLTAAARAKVIACLKSELETYSQYANGEVYGYVVEDSEGEDVDSCWGIFGFDYAKSEAEAAAKSEASHRAKQRFERLKTMIRNRVPLDVRAAEISLA